MNVDKKRESVVTQVLYKAQHKKCNKRILKKNRTLFPRTAGYFVLYIYVTFLNTKFLSKKKKTEQLEHEEVIFYFSLFFLFLFIIIYIYTYIPYIRYLLHISSL